MVCMNNFYKTYRVLRVSTLLVGFTITASAYVIDVEFDGPGRQIQDMQREDNRGRDEYERRGNGENLNDREKQEATHYEREHMA